MAEHCVLTAGPRALHHPSLLGEDVWGSQEGPWWQNFPLHPAGQSLGTELGQLWAGKSSDRCSGPGAAGAG